ncbi:hypothetical protein EUTSA_v10005075mg [Eutrema salsugineum]|uniref:Uncharacterized protein n=1 Tax=Eutrema salsugineum TaxID=72664 RepID=V4KMT7_EUTSA|nr:hypothetical protein EUTSA_v10005075mg [Eutrema salsugineum]
MRRREEKRRKLHEALLQTLYPPSSPSSLSSSPSPTEFDDEPFDVTLINPEDYVKIDSSNHGDENENEGESETAEKPSRAQRKRIRKKMLKEEAGRRRKVIGPLLPTDITQTRDAGRSNRAQEEESCLQPARLNAQEQEGTVFLASNYKILL